MAKVELSLAAVQDLERLITTVSLPGDTHARVRESLVPLQGFPRLGPELTGRWQGLRFLVGPWRWMLLVYEFVAEEDRLIVLTIPDARWSSAATSG